MTWIVGTPTMFGYAFCVSDIRVSWGERNGLDCLQKIYPVGRDIAAGFSGSVELGFWCIADLRRFLYHPDPRWA